VVKLPGLWDYGNKAWSGLVKGYYDRRYFIYAEQKMASIESKAVRRKRRRRRRKRRRREDRREEQKRREKTVCRWCVVYMVAKQVWAHRLSVALFLC
jgi:hypothetical protein